MNIQNTKEVVQEFNTFVSYAKAFGIDTNTNLPVIRAAFNKGVEIGEKYHVKDCNKNIIPPLQENKTVIKKKISDFHLKGWAFRNKIIEQILKEHKKPLTPQEILIAAKSWYDITWYEKSICGYIKTAISHGFPITHVIPEGNTKRGKYVHADYADKYKDVPEFEPIKKKYPMEKGLV
jgi:hypothetical protein